MLRSIRILAVALAATFATVPLAPAGAAPGPNTVVQDGEFEVRIPHDDFARVYKDGSHLGAWKVTVADVGVGRPVGGIVSGISGRKRQFLSLKDPTASPDASVGSVCQFLTLVPMTKYRLTFYSAAVSDEDVLIVVWDNAGVGQLREQGSTDPTDWTKHTFNLHSKNRSDGRLCFTGAGPGYPVVDQVRLVATD